MKLRPASVRIRLTLWYTLILTAIVLAFFTAVYLVVKASVVRQLDREAGSEFASISQALAEDRGELGEADSEMTGRAFRVDKDGATLFKSPAFKALGLTSLVGPTARAATGEMVRLKAGPIDAGLSLTIAIPAEPVYGVLYKLRIIFLLALPVGLLLAALGGSVMAGRLLRPIAAMAARAEEISAESLSARLPVKDAEDEFGRMAGVINKMLSRLEEAFERLRRFTADASHELRTPLTVIQSVGEVALQEDLDPGAYRDRIGSMLEELSRMSRLVDSLLTLTRADAGAVTLRRSPLDAVRLAAQAVEDMRPLAEEKRQELTMFVGEPVIVQADEATLRLALVNILDNAVKYTPADGAVAVGVRAREGQAVIEIADSGPGVPAAHAGRIFDRFYRVDQSRTEVSGGSGLGLAIAKWAVEANGGRIGYEAREGGGSLFRVILPLVA